MIQNIYEKKIAKETKFEIEKFQDLNKLKEGKIDPLLKNESEILNSHERVYKALQKEDEIKKFREQLIIAEADNNVIKNELESFKNREVLKTSELENMKSLLLEANNKIKMYEQEWDNKDSNNNLLREELKKILEEKELIETTLSSELKEQKISINELELKIKSKEEDHNRICNEYEEEIEKLKMFIKSIDKQYEISKKEFSNENLSLKNQINQIKSSNDNLSKELANENNSKLAKEEIIHQFQMKENDLVYKIGDLTNKLQSESKQRMYIESQYLEEKKLKESSLVQISELNELITKKDEKIEEMNNKTKNLQLEVDKIPGVLQELEKVNEFVNNLGKEKEELIQLIRKKESECDYLNKDILSWKQILDQMWIENNQLKKMLEELEEKNKKLVETLNLHLYNKATEYKERALTHLKNTNSPSRVKQILSMGNKLDHVVPSPLRLQQLMDKEIVTTSKGVKEIKSIILGKEKNDANNQSSIGISYNQDRVEIAAHHIQNND